jgi:hypothetical protein
MATRTDFRARTHALTVSYCSNCSLAFTNLNSELDLPEYESYEVLRQQVLTAITAGSEYFGFA